jgi:hypothetical protein
MITVSFNFVTQIFNLFTFSELPSIGSKMNSEKCANSYALVIKVIPL